MPRPNILLITSDQQHWHTLGVNNPEIYTPNLDQLAAQGTVFTRAYCPNPTCTPTRVSMITGMYPSQHGAYSLGTKLPETVPTVGEYLGEAGYRTALVGKAHFQPLIGSDLYPSLESYPILQDLDFWSSFDEPFYGFDHVELARNHTNEAHVGQHYALWIQAQGCENWRDYYLPPTGNSEEIRHHWPIPEEYHYDRWIADRSNALLQSYQQRGESFFLWASFFDPHPLYLAPEPWDTMYDPAILTIPTLTPGEHDYNPPTFQLTQQPQPDYTAWEEPHGNHMHGFHSHLHDREALAKDVAVYYGMISLMDKYIGQILDKLHELGLAEKTLVVFTSDHGHLFGQHGLIAKGAFHYEDLLRVPMIVRYPGVVPAGKESDSLQSLVDYAPTFLSAAGLDIPSTMTAVDQKRVWFGEQDKVRDHVLVENHHQPTTLYLKTYIDQRYKITAYLNHSCGELFDLQEDPNELHNRWHDPAYAELKSQLLLELLQATMQAEPVWMPRIAGA